MKIRILGCGSSAGVPRIGNEWGACNPQNPKNNRTRCSILVQHKGANILIDTSPDLRQQVLLAGIHSVNAVLYTHAHADQCHGIDDLRMFTYLMNEQVSLYADKSTADKLERSFSYIFKQKPNSVYPAIATMTVFEKPFTIKSPEGEIFIEPFECHHGRIIAKGFKIDNFAYSPDVNEISNITLDSLKNNIDCWVVDALRYEPHPTHAHLERSLQWLDYVKVKQGILTNLHIDMDYDFLKAELPSHVQPAFDGMEIIC
jgi:phosphoribosyl 1,2-cyclic phosphate phosphodiesterase